MAVIEASAFPYGDREETSTVPDETGRWRRGCVKERAAVGLALYRSGARAALEAAINSVQAMVDDSAPLSDAHKAVSLYYVTGQLLGEPRLLIWASQYAICVGTTSALKAILAIWAGIHQRWCAFITGVPPYDQTR